MNTQDIASFLNDIKSLKAKADLQSDTNERFALASRKLGELLVATENMENNIAPDTSDQSGNKLTDSSAETNVTSLNQAAQKGQAGYSKPAPLTKWWREDQAKPLANPSKILNKADTKIAAVLSRPKERVEISNIPASSKKKVSETQPKKQAEPKKKAGFLSGLRNKNKVLKAVPLASAEAKAEVSPQETVPEKTAEVLSVADRAAQHVKQGVGQFEERAYENEITKSETSPAEMSSPKELLVSSSPGINDETKSATAKAAVATIIGLTTASAVTSQAETSETTAPALEENNIVPETATLSAVPSLLEVQETPKTETITHDNGNLVEDEAPLLVVEENVTEENNDLSKEAQLAAAATAATAAALVLSQSDDIEPEQTPVVSQDDPALEIIQLSDPQPGQLTAAQGEEIGFENLPEPELEYAQPAPEETIASSQIENSPLEIAANALEKPAVETTVSQTADISESLDSAEPVIGQAVAPDQSAVSKNISSISDDFSLQNTAQTEPVLPQASLISENPVESQPAEAQIAVPETIETILPDSPADLIENQPVNLPDVQTQNELPAIVEPEGADNTLIPAVDAVTQTQTAVPDTLETITSDSLTDHVESQPASLPDVQIENVPTAIVEPEGVDNTLIPAVDAVTQTQTAVPDTLETIASDSQAHLVEHQPVSLSDIQTENVPTAIAEPKGIDNTVIPTVETTLAKPDIPVAAVPVASLPVQGLTPTMPEAVSPQPVVPVPANPVATSPVAAIPAQNLASEPKLDTVSQEHIVLTGQDIQFHPEYGTKKKGLFSRLFGKK